MLQFTTQLLDSKVHSLVDSLEISEDTHNNQEMSQRSVTNSCSKRDEVCKTAVQNS